MAPPPRTPPREPPAEPARDAWKELDRTERSLAFDALVAEGPLSVAFQPIVDLATGRISAYEILGRCAAIEGPLAPFASSPLALLDAAHACGRLLALDRRWRSLALELISAEDDGVTSFFINVDPRVADDPAFAPGYTRALVERYGLPASRFVLELTEAISDAPSEIERVLKHYASQGFRIAIDDLGATRQSLATLLRVMPHVVKLDGSLVRGIDGDASRTHLLRALTEFASRTGAVLVAEAIETEAELVAVSAVGAHYGQGYLLGRPLPRPGPLGAPALLALQCASSSVASDASPAVRDPTLSLLRLVEGIDAEADLDATLRRVTDCAAELVGAPRASVRLLDESRTRLLVAARTGESVHQDKRTEFVVGEGLLGWIVANRQALRVARAEQDPRFSHRPNMASAVGSYLGVPLLDVDGCIGVLSASSPRASAFTAADERRLRLVAGIVSPHLQVGRLRRLAHTDPLTCFLNRHALDDVLPQQPAGEREPVSIAIVDIDHFKRINDLYGHAAGDDALRSVAQALGSVLRRNDRVVRIGGEEFLVVLPGVHGPAAELVADRARKRIAEALVVPGERLTASAGVAERRLGESRDELLARADSALYRAKAAGRDRVIRDEPAA